MEPKKRRPSFYGSANMRTTLQYIKKNLLASKVSVNK